MSVTLCVRACVMLLCVCVCVCVQGTDTLPWSSLALIISEADFGPRVCVCVCVRAHACVCVCVYANV